MTYQYRVELVNSKVITFNSPQSPPEIINTIKYNTGLAIIEKHIWIPIAQIYNIKWDVIK